MKKTFFLLVFLTFAIVSLCIYYVKVNEAGSHTDISLEKAFADSGAALASSELYFWSELKGRMDSREGINTLLEDVMSSLDMVKDEKFSCENLEDDTLEKVKIKGVVGNQRNVGIEVTIGKDAKASDKRYISMNITQDQAYETLEGTKSSIAEIFKSRGLDPRVNACITGTFAGNLDHEQLNEIGRKILRETGAKKVEGVGDGNYISVSAYTPYMERYIRVHGKKVNLNVALRYNSYENKTYIWLATPVITTEY